MSGLPGESDYGQEREAAQGVFGVCRTWVYVPKENSMSAKTQRDSRMAELDAEILAERRRPQPRYSVGAFGRREYVLRAHGVQLAKLQRAERAKRAEERRAQYLVGKC